MKPLYWTSLCLVLMCLFLGCAKEYQLDPQTPAGPTAPTPTPTSNLPLCTFSPTPGAPPSGIFWDSAQVEGITVNNGVTVLNGIFVQVLLSVNGSAETTDTVSVQGPGGLNTVIPYTSDVSVNGNTFAQYQALLSNSYQPGSSYSLKTVTSIGTASATLTGPGNVTIAANGTSASWTKGGMLNSVLAQKVGGVIPSSPSTFYQTLSCTSESSAVNIPLSNYASEDIYTVTVDCQNQTGSITGGKGFFKVLQNVQRMIRVTIQPTPTPETCGGLGPACTATPVGTPSVNSFSVAPVPYLPASGTLNAQVTLPYMSGYFNGGIYDSGGPLQKELLISYLSGSCNGCNFFAWDGTDKFGAPLPDGVYVASLIEPADWKLAFILLER